MEWIGQCKFIIFREGKGNYNLIKNKFNKKLRKKKISGKTLANKPCPDYVHK